jgi:uncharacterized cupin superfamily protein
MSSFKYVRLYSGPDGESHFEEVELELKDSGRGTDVSNEIPASSVNFSKFRDDYGFDQHTAPRDRFVVMLTGTIEVETSDGEVRVLGPGTVLRAEDLTGVGHKSRVIGSDERIALYVQFPT